MPDLKGMSVRKCIKVISAMGLNYKMNGNGKVVTQIPEPGTTITGNQQIIINCDLPAKF